MTYSNLANANYVLFVKAKDEAGHEDPTPANQAFTVDVVVPDTTQPDTSISTGPSGTIGVNNATFTWTGSDDRTTTANLQYAYRLDPIEASFSAFGSATTKTYTGLANGNYTLYVKAKDEAGLEDAIPASQPFTVSVVSGPSFTASPTSLAGGGLVTITWSGVTTPRGRDWIGLYRVGAADTAYAAFQYVNCTQSPGVTGLASGSCTFRIGLTGTFEFRYFRNNGFTKLATSNPVTVGATGTLPTVTIHATTPTATEGGAEGQFTVTRTGSTTTAVTVNYTVSGTASNGPDYSTLSGSVVISSGASTAVLPVLPVDDPASEGNETVIVTVGTGSYTTGTPSSATVIVVDNDTAAGAVLTASPVSLTGGGTVTVTWSGVPSPSKSDWIGLYRAGALNTAYAGWKYASSCTQSPGATGRASGSCTFQVGGAGTYEFRFLPNNGLTSIATSNPVTVR